MPSLDLDFVRAQFPAFSEPSLQGWGFFENAGGSYTCQQVIGRLTHYYTKTKVQPYGPYPAAQAAGAAMDESYRRMADYLNVGEDEVNFGPSTSQNSYVLAQALRGMWQDGDEIIVSNQDHEANAGVWRRLAKTGIVVKEWHVDPESGQLNPADLDNMLTNKTRMIAFPHCSNVVAHVNPVAEIAAKGKAAGAIIVTDGVAFAPHGLPDVAALGVDIYMFSLYKTWGPHLGLMVVKRELLQRVSNQGHYFNDGLAHKMLTPAGPDHAQIAAAAGVADYFDAVYAHHFKEDADAPERGRRLHDLFQAHEKELLTPLLGWLRNRDDVRIVGPDDPELRAPTVSIIPQKKSISEVVSVLTEHKLMVGSGDFYAVRPLQGMNISLDPGVLRLSFLHYTSEQEIEQLIGGLTAALA
ncbi:MAG: aminotransferase class V-fold PLP-dependent enzyme [Chloroflexi bacterium]|nr:aminotransferase class V-fold PLP-dependent enzyme [Chloroflexota bacterium]